MAGTCKTQHVIIGSYAVPITPDKIISLPIQTDHLTYSGPNLPCTGIKTYDTLTIALQKIDERICELAQQIHNLGTTTTTSTTHIPTTTTTTIIPTTTTTTTEEITTTTSTTLEETTTTTEIPTTTTTTTIDCYSGLSKFSNYGGGKIIKIADDRQSALIISTTDIGVESTWEDAITNCNALSLNGYDDWRLPTLAELNIIGDSIWQGNLTIYDWTAYWSADSIDTDYAWGWRFGDGTVSGTQYSVYNIAEGNLKTGLSLYVRPVRTDTCGEAVTTTTTTTISPSCNLAGYTVA